jgi:HEAT repeat protein
MSFFSRLFGPPNVEKLKAKGDVQGLIKALGYQKDARVRIAVINALQEIGTVQAIGPLRTALKDPESTVRWAAVEALLQVLMRSIHVIESGPFN